ncbi:glycosyltransferase [Actinomyces sp. 186855]|nr:glycosyltransferase [Actinomyces sp. AC-20-1]MCL3789989.1 glycosyltransferase [Actinomyces sp. 187325]MCL3791533.1 glycosyltransferase [Actinomyces sp. 186855]MCL3793814.1 glycosyltransferase [Actinomyces sp. 217892]
MRRCSPASEEGQTLLLGIGLMAVVAALLLTVASVTAVYLDVKRLTSLADSAAAAAARSVGPDTYYQGAVSAAGSVTGAVPGALTDAAVSDAAAQDLASQSALVGLEGVELVQAHASGGDTAVVTLTARSRPPFLPWGVIPSEGFEITATSTARVTVGQE